MIPAAIREFVRVRADERCEHCRLPQSASAFAAFQVEHIRPRQHGGGNRAENLALACPRCNAFKGPNLAGVDSQTEQIVRLFNPRSDSWDEHFEIDGALLRGITSIGRATVEVLQMNEPQRVKLRQRLIDIDEFG